MNNSKERDKRLSYEAPSFKTVILKVGNQLLYVSSQNQDTTTSTGQW